MALVETARIRDKAASGVGAGERSRAIRGGGFLVACKWAAQLLSWGGTLGVARLLRPEDFGVIASAGLLLGLCDLFAEAGVGRALVQKDDVTPLDYDRAFTISVALSAACYLALLAGAPSASRWMRAPELTFVLPVMALYVLLVPFKTVPLGIMDRRLELKKQGLMHVVSIALQSSTVLTLAWLGAGYWALAAGALFSRVFECGTLAYFTGWRPRLTADLQGSAALLRYGLWMSGGSLLWYVYSNSDFAVVGRLEGPVVLGVYSLAFQLMSMPMQKVAANINQVAFPVLCRMRNEPERARNWYVRLTALMVAAVLPALLGGALVADDGIPTIFGARWSAAVQPFQVLCVVGLLNVFGASLITLLNALGRPDVNFKYTAVCACVYPAAFALTGRAYGVMGVCYAWVVLYSVGVSLLATLTKRITRLGLRDLIAPQLPALFAGGVMAAAVLAVRHSIGAGASAPARLVASVAAGVVSYSLAFGIAGRNSVIPDIRSLWGELRKRGT